jgi:CRISPR-associated protein Cmr4
MYQKAKTLFMICETPLHAGSGDSLGIVDMPIQRERHTSFPKIEASSLKGALREFFENGFIVTHTKRDHPDVITAFGAEDGSDKAGSLGFTDARLLLFPIKSMRGVFAWVTCPRALKQFAKDMALANKDFKIEGIDPFPSINENSCYLLNSKSNLTLGNNKVVLEEYAFDANLKDDLKIGGKNLCDWLADNLFAEHLYWKEKAQKDIVILSDNDFQDFVNLSTEVITRTRIDNETGTVATGALFTEEYLPTESVLYSLVLASPEFSKEEDKKTADENMAFFTKYMDSKDVFQLGGNATLGKGILRTVVIK